MDYHEHVPSEVEPTSLDELVADGAAVRRVLDESRLAVVPGPSQRVRIPESALAAVSGLDTYGD
jgi:hypothetical protein